MTQIYDCTLNEKVTPCLSPVDCMPEKGNKIMTALSGGVDSAVTALRLIRLGYAVEGVTMTLFDDSKAFEEAQKTADFLKIRLHHLDLRKEFETEVMQYFCKTYAAGQTPNPCVVCNPRIKFRLLLDFALGQGACKLATGHYARIKYDQEMQQYFLLKGSDPKKDQSYFLYGLSQEVLSKTIFPLGNSTKDEVRREAALAGIPPAEKKDSQEVCFIPGDNYQAFLRQYGCSKGFEAGRFVDHTGKILGRHQGIACYTIGQRKGLGIALQKPAFVLKIDPHQNQVVLGDDADLFSKTLISSQNHFISGEFPKDAIPVAARIRSGAAEAPAMLYPVGPDRIKLVFEQAQRAITPGQAVVFYQDDRVLGGGMILP